MAGERDIVQRAFSKLFNLIPASLYSHFAWQFCSSLLIIISGFLYGVLVARYLGPAEYGVWALGLSIATLSLRFFEATIYEALVYFLSLFVSSNDSTKVFAIVRAGIIAECAVSTLGVLLLALASPILSDLFVKDYDASTIIILSGLVIALGKSPTYTAYATLRVLEDFRSGAIIRVIGQLATLIAVATSMYWLHCNIVEILVVELCIRAFTSLAFVITMNRKLISRYGNPSSFDTITQLRPYFFKMWLYIKSSYLSSILLTPTKELDIIILAYWSTPSSVGVYQLAKRFMIAVEAASDAVVSVIFPEISKRWTEGRFKELGRLIRNLTGLLFTVSIVIVFLTFCFFPFLVNLLLSPEFNEVNALMSIMIITTIVRLPLEWTSPLLLAIQKPNLVYRGAMLSGLITILLYLVAIPLADTYGAAFVYSSSTPIWLIVLFVYLLKGGTLKIIS